MEMYAPDTNFFLQCQWPDQIDWKRVTGEKEVVLLVVREVRKELDRLKSSGNQRRSKRARAASAILRRLTSEGTQEIELRATGPRVVLRSAPRPPVAALPSDYRIESADERIVAEVYAAGDTTEGRITFLSHDTVPLEDAAGLGLRTQVVPEEWLLDPEPSDIERELNDVKRRMKALEGRSPDIVIDVPADDAGCIRLESPYWPSLSKEFISIAVREVRKKHALGSIDNMSFQIGSVVAEFERADKAKWDKYAQDHEKWLDDIEFALNDAWRHMNEDPNGMKLVLTIANKGNAGAENLIVSIEVSGDFHLVDVDALEVEADPTRYFPTPPARPSLMLVESVMGIGYTPYKSPFDIARRFATSPIPPMARDRHSLYWEYDDDRNATCIEGQCQDFRHGLPSNELVLSLERTAIGDEPVRGAVKILVSAGNLAEAKKVTYPVHIEAKHIDTETFMRGLLKRELDVDV